MYYWEHTVILHFLAVYIQYYTGTLTIFNIYRDQRGDKHWISIQIKHTWIVIMCTDVIWTFSSVCYLCNRIAVNGIYITKYQIIYLPESGGCPLVGSLFGFDWLSEKLESCLLFRAVDLFDLGNGPFSIISNSPYIRFISALFSSINLSIRSLNFEKIKKKVFTKCIFNFKTKFIINLNIRKIFALNSNLWMIHSLKPRILMSQIIYYIWYNIHELYLCV